MLMIVYKFVCISLYFSILQLSRLMSMEKKSLELQDSMKKNQKPKHRYTKCTPAWSQEIPCSKCFVVLGFFRVFLFVWGFLFLLGFFWFWDALQGELGADTSLATPAITCTENSWQVHNVFLLSPRAKTAA